MLKNGKSEIERYMKLNNIFNRKKEEITLPLFDETFLRRLERYSFHTAPALRGGLSGERRSRNLRPALDFSDHRPYTHGDDLRHIDWNAYSRHEELFVKLGEAPQSINVHILLDYSRSMAWSPSQNPELVDENNIEDVKSQKWDSARRLAGALGYLGLSGGERVVITSFANTMGKSFGPTQGKRQVIPLLQFITTIMPASPPQPSRTSGLVSSLASYARQHSRGGLLVLISDLLDTVTTDGTDEEWEELAEGLRYFPPPRWQVLVLHLLTEAEMHPKIAGDYDLQDVETSEILPFHVDEAMVAQYRLRVRRWCSQLQSACGMRAATYARVLAEWPFEQTVIPYLRQRGAIQ